MRTVETAQDPNGRWYVLVNGSMDVELPYSNDERDAYLLAIAKYGRPVLTTDHPDHYSNRA